MNRLVKRISGLRYSLNVIYAFMRRDVLLMASYRFNTFLQFFEVIVLTMGWYFLAKMFAGSSSPYLAAYGGDFFAFLIIGVSFYNLNHLAIKGFSEALRNAQLTGTIESIYQSQVKTITFLAGSMVWPAIYASLRALLFIFLAITFFGLKISSFNIWLFALVLVLSITANLAYGLIAACFVILYKEGNPIAIGVNVASQFLGGLYVPISVLPAPLRIIAYMLPSYFSLEAVRRVVLVQGSLADIWFEVLVLLVFTFIVFPISVAMFNYAIRIAKKNGNLTQY